MKKLFLLSALVLGAMTMSAQLSLVKSFNFLMQMDICIYSRLPEIQYIAEVDTTGVSPIINFYSIKSFNLEKSVTLSNELASELDYLNNKNYLEVMYPFKNFWSLDGNIEFSVRNYNVRKEFLVDENGNKLQEFKNGVILPTTNGYYYADLKNDDKKTDIYLIPGNGQPTDLEAPTAPSRTSNARKVVENGQMYIILDGVKYAVAGTEL